MKVQEWHVSILSYAWLDHYHVICWKLVWFIAQCWFHSSSAELLKKKVFICLIISLCLLHYMSPVDTFCWQQLLKQSFQGHARATSYCKIMQLMLYWITSFGCVIWRQLYQIFLRFLLNRGTIQTTIKEKYNRFSQQYAVQCDFIGVQRGNIDSSDNVFAFTQTTSATILRSSLRLQSDANSTDLLFWIWAIQANMVNQVAQHPWASLPNLSAEWFPFMCCWERVQMCMGDWKTFKAEWRMKSVPFSPSGLEGMLHFINLVNWYIFYTHVFIQENWQGHRSGKSMLLLINDFSFPLSPPGRK